MAGRVDTYTAPDLQGKLEALTEEGHYNIILDMSEINFLSSKGLWVLTETHKRCKKHSGRLALSQTNDKIRGSFKLVGMEGFFDIYDELITAVGSF
jgi:anti-sigma B factor antagonist